MARSGNWTDPGSPFGVASTVFAVTAGILYGTLMGNVQRGIFFGFAFGLAMALCMIPFMRTKRAIVQFDDRPSFERRLAVEMSELMYTPTVVNPDMVCYAAPQTGTLEYGPLKNVSAAHLNQISAHFGPTGATVIGPRWMVGKVLARINTASPQVRPAGWYPDPARRFDVRFWDGHSWTDHVQAGGTPGLDRFG